MKARSNPEWHHVNLETVRNIDIDMLDEKRQRYLKIYKELIKTVNDVPDRAWAMAKREQSINRLDTGKLELFERIAARYSRASASLLTGFTFAINLDFFSTSKACASRATVL